MRTKILLAMVLATAATTASAHDSVGFSISLGAPAYYYSPPAPVYAPPPAVYYRPAPIYYRYYSPAPVVRYYYEPRYRDHRRHDWDRHDGDRGERRHWRDRDDWR